MVFFYQTSLLAVYLMSTSLTVNIIEISFVISVREVCVKALHFLLHHRIHICILLFPLFSAEIIVLTYIQMCPSIFYLLLSTIGSENRSKCVQKWEFDTVRIMSDMCQTKKKQPWNPQAASAAVKCNPGTSGFVQESVCEWDHLQQNRHMEYIFETFHYCNSVFILGGLNTFGQSFHPNSIKYPGIY